MVSLPRTASSRVSPPYLSSLGYNSSDLSEGVKSMDLDSGSECHLRPGPLGPDGSLEGIVVAADDLEEDNGHPHEFPDSKGQSSSDSSNTDTANADTSDTYDTDNEQTETLFQKVFSDLLEDPDWPNVQGFQRTIQLEPSEWNQFVQFVLYWDDLYRFSFQYNTTQRILTMSTPTYLHEKVSNFMSSLITTRYGERHVLKLPSFKGVLTTETKRESVGPLPVPNSDSSAHARRLIGPALSVPDGAVIPGFPKLMGGDDNVLRSKHGEHVVGVIEKGFYETCDHVLFRTGQYSSPSTLNKEPRDLPVFMLTVKIVEHPKYSSPISSKLTTQQKRELQDQWSPIEADSLHKHDPSDRNEMLTGKVTIGEHTFCRELEAYLVLVSCANEHRAALREGYDAQWQLPKWLERGFGIKLRKKYEGAEEQALKNFASLWKTVFKFQMYQLHLWEKGGEAWHAYNEAQLKNNVDVYAQDSVREAWSKFLASAPFKNPGTELDEVPLREPIEVIEAGAVSTALQRFATFKRQFCEFSPDPPAAAICKEVPLASKSEDDMQNLKRKAEMWAEMFRERDTASS